MSTEQVSASFTNLNMSDNIKYPERTFIMVKPDGVQRGLAGEIMSRFERRGYQMVACELQSPSREHLEKHYSDLSSKPFFTGLVDFMISGPVLAMVFVGKDVVKTGRRILGETNPLSSNPGTIRGDFGIDMGRNICHGSDSVESAEKEIALWFPNGVRSYSKTMNVWIYE